MTQPRAGHAAGAPVVDSPPSSARWLGNVAPVAALLVAAVVGAGLWIFGSVRQLVFTAPEWQLAQARADWTLSALLAPVDGSWATVPLAIYKLLLEWRGLTDYGAFAAALAIAHLVAAIAVFALATRYAGPWLGLVASVAMLAVGWAPGVLLSPLALGVPLAVASGIASVILWDADRPSLWRDALGLIAGAVAVASNAVGLAFVLVAMALLLARRTPRLRLVWPLLVLVLFVAWLAAVRVIAGAPAGSGEPLLDPLPLAASIAALGGALLGVGRDWGAPAAVALAILLGVVLTAPGRRLPAVLLLAGIAAVQLLVATPFARGDPSGAPLYASIALALPAVAALLSGLVDLENGWPRRPRVRGLVVAWLLVFTVGGALTYHHAQSAASMRGQTVRGLLATIELVPDVPSAALAAVIDAELLGQMTVGQYRAASERWGSPVDQWSAPMVRALPLDVRLRTDPLLFRLVADELMPTVDGRPPDELRPARWVANPEADLIRRSAGCSTFAVGGRDPLVYTNLFPGEHLFMRADGAQAFRLYASGFSDAHTDGASLQAANQPGSWLVTDIPTRPADMRWSVRVDPPADATRLELCIAATP